MQNHDEAMESYLKEFTPRAIRPLEQEQRSPNFWPRRLAAAAVIVLAGGLSLWVTSREGETVPSKLLISLVQRSSPSSQQPMSTFLLTKLALDDNKRFDVVLTEQSRRVLPSLQGQESTLRVFAGE